MDIQVAGKKSTVSVSDAVFGAGFNEPLVHQVVTAYLAGGRSGTKAQKTRSQVRGGGRKPYRQKGTGQARAGTIRSPIWRGGGRTFAATPRDHAQKVNRKMYRGALRAIISELARQSRLQVVENFDVAEPKTKVLAAALGKLKVTDVLVVSESVSPNLYLAARNLQGFEVSDVESLNPVLLLSRKQVLVTKAAIEKLEGWLS